MLAHIKFQVVKCEWWIGTEIFSQWPNFWFIYPCAKTNMCSWLKLETLFLKIFINCSNSQSKMLKIFRSNLSWLKLITARLKAKDNQGNKILAAIALYRKEVSQQNSGKEVCMVTMFGWVMTVSIVVFFCRYNINNNTFNTSNVNCQLIFRDYRILINVWIEFSGWQINH